MHWLRLRVTRTKPHKAKLDGGGGRSLLYMYLLE